MKKNKAVFFDRDGVLNKAIIKNGKPHPPSTMEELVIPDGVQTALQTLKSAGFLLIGATNQPDVVRGTTSKTLVEEINSKLLHALSLDDILVCYHDDNDHCECRKPKPGLLIHGAQKHNIDLESSIMIGDRWKDIEAGFLAGCKTIWLDYKYQERHPTNSNYITSSIIDGVEWITKNLIISKEKGQ